MEALQLNTARLCVNAFAANELDKVDSHLSDRDDLTWEIRPGSLEGSWMGGERRGKKQVSELWRKDRGEVYQDIKRMASSAVESEPKAFEGELAFFLEFEPGTDKILKGIKFVDSGALAPLPVD
ncbi:hypothetical protein JCM5296_006475 [Sporobolomyces johnsonii]